MFFFKNFIYSLSLHSRLLTGTLPSGNTFSFTVYYFRSPEWLPNGEWRDVKAMNGLSRMHVIFTQIVFLRLPTTVCPYISRYYILVIGVVLFFWVLFYGASTRHCDLQNRCMFTSISLWLVWKFNRGKQFLLLYRKDTSLQCVG